MAPFLLAAIIIGVLAMLVAIPDVMRWRRRRRRRSRTQRRPLVVRLGEAPEEPADPGPR